MIAAKKPSFITSVNLVSEVISSLDVEHPVNTNAIAITVNSLVKRLFVMKLSLFILLYYNLFKHLFQIIFILGKTLLKIRFPDDDD